MTYTTVMLESKISRKLTFHARHSIKEAGDIAVFCQSSHIKPKYLLLALFKEKGSLGNVLLTNMGFTETILEKHCVDTLKKKTVSKAVSSTKPQTDVYFSEETKQIITRAYAIASQFSYPYVGSEHLVYATIESTDKDIQKLLLIMDAKKKDIQGMLRAHVNTSDIPNLSKIFNLPQAGGQTIGSQTKQSSATPFLDQYGINLTEEVAGKEEILSGRAHELERMVQILGRRNKNNPLLIGEPGVGKTTLVSALAKKMAAGQAGPHFLNKKIISIDLALVVAGTSFRGEFEARLKEIIFEATEHKDIILFIDEIHTIIGAGNTSGGLDAANILKPALSRGDLQCIGATTFAEYKKHIEKDPAFERRFQSITINEPSDIEAKEMLIESKVLFEVFHNTRITEKAIDAAVELSTRFIPDRFLPDKALDLIDEAASSMRQKRPTPPVLKKIWQLEKEKSDLTQLKESAIQDNKLDEAMQLLESEKIIDKNLNSLRVQYEKAQKKDIITIDDAHIATVVSQITKIPLHKIIVQKKDSVSQLKKNLEQHIIGQDHVLQKLTETLTRSFSGISNPDRPVGSFLFLGPSGVGKTLVAKILSESLFESKNALIRLDMSEFAERHSIAQIIGAPAGYVGYGEGGKLTEKIRRKPYSVILFDEIEKAHPDVFNILLQILDDGILTDAEGRKVSFKNTIIILTSNIGTQAFSQSKHIGFNDSATPLKQNSDTSFATIEHNVLNEVKHQLRPELLNRLDHIIVFKPLTHKDIASITKLELEALKNRLKKQHVDLRYKKDLVEFIVIKSASKEQGARFIHRTIQNTIETLLAQKILGTSNADRLTISIVKDEVRIR